MKNQVAQVHFEISISQKNKIRKMAKLKGISESEFYRRSITKELRHEKFVLKNKRFNQKLDNDESPILHSKKEFYQWLKE